jgi:DNA-binding NarL/FixJ family response regulator
MMKIVVAADRPIVLMGLRHALSREFRDATIEAVPNATKCLRVVRGWHPQLTVVDVHLPPRELHELCESLHEAQTGSIFLTSHPRVALDLIEGHAEGIASYRDGLSCVIRACRTVADHHTYVSSALLGGVLEGLIERQRRRPQGGITVERLSHRERQVFALLGSGRDQTAIARRLDIAPQTAKTHIRHVLTKLGARSRVEAAAMAVELGFDAKADNLDHVDL